MATKSAREVAVEFATPLDESRALIRERSIKASPEIEKARNLVGIITQSDWVRGLHHAVRRVG